MKNYFLLLIGLASCAAYGSGEFNPLPGGLGDEPYFPDANLVSRRLNFLSPMPGDEDIKPWLWGDGASEHILSPSICSLIREYSDQAAVPSEAVPQAANVPAEQAPVWGQEALAQQAQPLIPERQGDENLENPVKKTIRGAKRKAPEKSVQNRPGGDNDSAELSESPAPKRPKPFKCERRRCNESFASKSDFEYHARVHAKEKPFECVMCGQRFRQRSALTVHLRVHSGYKPFKCGSGDCGREFSDNANLIRHQLVHTGERRFECDQCPLKFAQKGNLKTHQQVHSGEKPFECPDCGKCFRRKAQLQRHVQSNVCREDAQSREPVELPAPRNQEDKLFVCDVGEREKPFSRAAHLKNHKRVHTGERRFECDQCPRKFTQKSNLKDHQRVHSGEKPFKCSECLQAFSQKGNLKRHKKEHSGEKPFKCPDCEKGFSQKSNMLKHRSLHAADALALLAQDDQAE